jgi:hypothetical protein
MQAHPDRKRGREPRSQSPGSSNRVEGEFRRHPGVIGAHAADRHVVVADTAADDPEGQARVMAFVQGLQQWGWIVGDNLRIDTRWTAGDPERTR